MNGVKPSWNVAFTRCAENDILNIFTFIAERDGPDIAEIVLKQFVEVRDGLRELPDRGRVPLELEQVNIHSFREIQAKPYRIVCQVNKAAHEVYIHLVADGWRNFSELLKERLISLTISNSAVKAPGS